MLNKPTFLIAAIIALSCKALVAQTNEGKLITPSQGNTAQPDANKTGTTTIIVTEQGANKYFSTKPSANNFKTSIKLNPLLILNGDIPVFVERKLTKHTSIELGAGPTVQDYMRSLIRSERAGYDYESVKNEYKTGISAFGGFRYYPSENTEALEGYYFAPEFRYRSYNLQAVSASMQNGVDSVFAKPYKYSNTVKDFRLVFGQTNFFENNIFTDIYLGVGIRSRDETRLSSQSRLNNQGFYYNQLVVETKKGAVPLLVMGFKIGFSF